MSDYPTNIPTPLFVHTYTRWASTSDLGKISGAGVVSFGSITWPGADIAFYVPIAIPWPYPVKRVYWINGSSVTSVNMDFGIYTADGTRIYSTGATAASGVSATQYTTPSPDFILPAGRYYFALMSSSATANRGGQGTVGTTAVRQRLVGMLEQATANPLPATMTGASVTHPCVPACGVTRTASGF